MLKKILIIFLFLSLILVNGYMTISYATAVKVTDENLKSSLQKFVSSSDNDKNYNITVENKQIKITSDDGNYTINYDLTNKTTFTYEADITQGMSYKDFQEKTNGSSSTMIGYIAVADIQGVGYEDSLSYFAMCLLASAFSGMSSANTNNSFVIVDDTNMSEGVTIEKDPNDTKTIYASEFGDHVMEYVNSLYSEKQIFKDTDGLNTFEMSTERKDVTATSCKLVTTLTVDADAEFSKMIGYGNQLTDSMMNKNITEENVDYLIKLKVGQKCKIQSTEEITGYETSGSSCIEFSEDRTLITATAVGKTNGYIYVGNNETKKSIYVIVEENTGNQTLDTITININTISDTNNTDKPNVTPIKTETLNNNKQTTTTIQDTTTKKATLPQTGTNEVYIISAIGLVVIICIVLGIKNKKYKDVK